MKTLRVEEIYQDKIYPVEPKEWLKEYLKDHVEFKKFCAQERMTNPKWGKGEE